METGIILVAGVSGVGKTTLCQRLAEVEPGIHHLIASSFVEGKRTADQLGLAGRIRAAAEGLNGNCLVDGHLIVGGEKVSQEAVTALAPRAILVVTSGPADIVAQRTADTVRARPLVTEEDICHAQEAEVGWARELALAISVPFATIDGQDEEGFRTEVHHLLGTA